jgi:hypothetical protein
MQALSERWTAMTEDKKEPTGRAKGGIARAAKMTPEARSLQAKKAALVRHGLKATHKGNFKDEFGFDVECYVLNDAAKTAVISLRGLGVALGFAPGSSERVPSFVSGAKIAPYVGRELRDKLENPLIFQGPRVVAGKASFGTAFGYDVTLLIDLCKVIVQAESDAALQKRHDAIAKQAHVILGASAKAGIKGLAYALAGYRPEVEEVIQAFKVYVQEEARKYEKEFPNELYMQWHRLYSIPVPVRGKSWHLKHLTVNHIYTPLANSDGKLLDMLRDLKANDGERKKKLFQFLNEVGARALRMHLGRVLEMCESSADRFEYEAKIVARFGGQQAFDLTPVADAIA